jgi:hypothetical protein
MPALPDQLPSARSAPESRAGEDRGGRLNPPLTASNPILSVAGGLSLAGVLLGILLLLLTCSGFDAALYFSPAVLALAIAGGIMTTIAARHSPTTQTGPVLASLFMTAVALLGGVLQLAVWLQWPILFAQK